MQSSPPPADSRETVQVDRGGAFSRLVHRSALRDYSRKIRERTATCDELKDYLAKGGSPTVLSRYAMYDDFELPLLNYFITGLSPIDVGHHNSPYEIDQRQGLDQCLRLLLDNGADVAFAKEGSRAMMEYSPPFLFASWLGNVEVMALLIEYGADVDQLDDQRTLASEPWGPPLLLVPSDEAAELLLRHGADVSFKMPGNGLNLAQLLVKSNHYRGHEAHVLRRLSWFKAKGFTFPSLDDSIALAQRLSREYNAFFPYVTEGVERKQQTWAQIVQVLEDLRE